MSVWRAQQPLILASQSETRKTLLIDAGLNVETVPADIDERAIQKNSGLTDASAIASLLAFEKARHVSAKHSGRYVVGADQTLALGERLFSKPDNRNAAVIQLQALAGQTHQLHSAVNLFKDGRSLFDHTSAASMSMRKLTVAEIAAYLDAAGTSVTTSVGAYQLEGLGAHLFERIEGDHFTILGLPLLPLLGYLRSENLLTV